MAQTGWSSPLTWFQIILLIAAAVGVFYLLRYILGGLHGGGGSSGGGGGGGAIYPRPPHEPNWRMHVPHNPKITDFSMPRDITEIKTPSPAEPPKMNMDLARRLFTINQQDLNQAKKNFVGDVPKTEPKENQQMPTQEINQPKQEPKRYTGPDWKMASDLFIPKMPRNRRKNTEEEDE